MATVDKQPARIPAWKRLGLQLKNHNTPESKKRNFDNSFSSEKPAVKQKENGNVQTSTTIVTGTSVSKKRKSVAFSHDTKQDDGNDAEHQLQEFMSENTGGENGFSKSAAADFVQPSVFDRSQASEMQPKSNETQQQPIPQKSERSQKKRSKQVNTEQRTSNEETTPTYVQYLLTFHTDRDNWKFNKNNQTSVLKHLFDLSKLPETLDPAIQAYIRGLQGETARRRVREQAEAIIQETDDPDMESTDEERLRTYREREAAAKRQLLNHKISKREKGDVEATKTHEFKNARRRRWRAQCMLSLLLENGLPTQSLRQFEAEADNRIKLQLQDPIAAISNRLPGPYSGKMTVDKDGHVVKQGKVRKKMVTIGADDEDMSSVSSEDSDSSDDDDISMGADDKDRSVKDSVISKGSDGDDQSASSSEDSDSDS